MFDRLQSRTRTILAMCCMALTTVLAAQGAITTVDQAQHALGIDHAPTALAGTVHYDHDDDHADAAVQVTVDTDLAHADDNDAGPAHHHAAEGPQLATFATERWAQIVLVRMPVPPARRMDGLPLLVAIPLERPPKTDSKTIA